MQVKTETYKFLMTKQDQMVINNQIGAFGRWNTSSNNSVTNGVVYPILGDGDFDDTVKFLNNEGHVDEASVKFFQLATRKSYSHQFKKLEVISEAPAKKQNK